MSTLATHDMTRKTLTISVSPVTLRWVRDQVELGGHDSMSAFIRGLILDRQSGNRKRAAELRNVERLRAKIQDSSQPCPECLLRSRRGQSKRRRVK